MLSINVENEGKNVKYAKDPEKLTFGLTRIQKCYSPSFPRGGGRVPKSDYCRY